MKTFISLPAVLQPYAEHARWVVWKFVTKKGKATKPPYQARHPDQHASSTKPTTWATFDDANAAYSRGEADGIGLCLLNSDLAAFDLDDCRDPATGKIEPAAQRLIERAHSYVEITPSGTGLRILLTAKGPKVHRKQPVPNANGMTIETYRQAERFITVTGDALPGVRERTRGRRRADRRSGRQARRGEEQAKQAEGEDERQGAGEARSRRYHSQRRGRAFRRRSVEGRLVRHQRNDPPGRR